MKSSLWSLFQCQRCGLCCEKLGLPWNGYNIEKMAEFLKMDLENLVARYYGEITMENGQRFVSLDSNLTRPCPLLKKDKTCRIYPVQPNEYKVYPIETDFGRCRVDCPAMKVIDEQEVEKEEDSAVEPVYLLFENPEEKGVLSPPFGYICLYCCSHIELLGNEHIALSPQCNSVAELKWWAEYIRKHLNRVAKEAEEKFGRPRKEMVGATGFEPVTSCV